MRDINAVGNQADIIKAAGLVFDLETPLSRAKALLFALRAIADSDDVRGEAGEAIYVITNAMEGFLSEIDVASREAWATMRGPAN